MDTKKFNILENGQVQVGQIANKEAKKKKILEALVATGIEKDEIPFLTVEVLAERVPKELPKGVRVSSAVKLDEALKNPAASVLVGAML